MYDTGTSVGEINGHSKAVNSCSIRPCRPFKIVTCSDDSQVNFYSGPPYKFGHSVRKHTGFVNCVRYSPNGELFVSVGSDAKVSFYG